MVLTLLQIMRLPIQCPRPSLRWAGHCLGLGLVFSTGALAQNAPGNLLPPPPPGPNPVPSPSATLNPVVNPASGPAISPAAAPNFPDSGRSYRVLAVVQSPDQEQQVLSLFPTAFRTRYQGQTLWQVGRFQDPTNAQQVSLQLQNLGVAARIEP